MLPILLEPGLSLHWGFCYSSALLALSHLLAPGLALLEAPYRVIANNRFLLLPSERTLLDYTHWCSVTDGVQIPFTSIEHAQKVLKDEGMGKDKPKFTLLMDEIKIKQCLVFSKCSYRRTS